MNHLKITQQEGITEYCSSEIPVKIYELDSSGQLDGGSTFVGTIQVDGAYKYQIDYLTKKYNSFHINANEYWVHFNDSLFESMIAKKINGTSHLTEEEANTVTTNIGLFTYFDGTIVKEIDFTPFKNFKHFYAGNTAENDNFLNNTQNASVLNFGNIETISNRNNRLDQTQFGTMIGSSIYVDTIIGENLKYIGVFALRNTWFREIYLPEIIGIAEAQGTTNSNNNSSINFRKHFVFLGSNFKQFVNMSSFFTENNDESNNGIIVIAAKTPPKCVNFNNIEGSVETGWNAPTQEFTGNKYNAGAWNWYVPTSALDTYKNDVVFQVMDGLGKLHPFSELPEEYKQKVSKWYTE